MSTSCWVAQPSIARQPSAKQLATKHTLRGGARRQGLLHAAAMTSHVFTWLPGDEPPSCQTQHWEECLWFVTPQPPAKQHNDRY
jgi:hypothetical protein